MRFPKPWADSDPESLPAELVRAARQQTLDPSDRAALWAEIQTRISVGAKTVSGETGPVGNTSPATASPVAASAWVKGTWTLMGALAVGTAGSLVWHLASRPSPATPLMPNVSDTASSSTRVAETRPQSADLASDEVASPRRVPPAEPAPSVVPSSTLREESRLLLEARAALRGERPALALRLLRRAAIRYPHGALAEEREALTIEALAEQGQSQEAAERAEAYLRHFPRSPHAADVRRYLVR